MTETALDYATAIQRVTSSLKKQFHMVEREDIYQELWLKYLSTDCSEMNGKMLWATLRRAGVAFCVKEKAAITGYSPEDLYYYSIGQLRELLPIALSPEDWSQPGVVSDLGKVTGTSDPAHGNSRLAMICDITSSLEAGSDEDKALLLTHYGGNVGEQEHAESLGITDDALRMRVVRAVGRLQQRLGGNRPYQEQGVRKALSNAQAQAITRGQEAEE